MFANFVTAIPTAAGMTFLLIFAMQSLISMQPMTVDERPAHKLGIITLKPRDETLNTLDFDPKVIPEVVPTPPMVVDQQYDPTSSGTGTRMQPPRVTEHSGPITSPFGSDGPLVAIVRVQPTYPAAQSSRGIEGYVTVMFDVLPDGTVSNIVVLESSSRGFERSAIQAASRFRYKARVVDGIPQTSTGVRYRFTYEIDD